MCGEGFEQPTYSINNSEQGRVMVNEKAETLILIDLNTHIVLKGDLHPSAHPFPLTNQVICKKLLK